MSGSTRSSTGRRGRGRITRAVLVAGLVLVALLAAPGAATAAPPAGVEPVLECYRENPDGTWTVVLGFHNRTGRTVRIPHGPDNRIQPSKYAALAPTTFKPGRVKGVVAAGVSAAELRAGAGWTLDGTVLDYRSAAAGAKVCPGSTELPAEGNGTGTAIGLALAGLVGVGLVRRARKRAEAGEGTVRGDA